MCSRSSIAARLARRVFMQVVTPGRARARRRGRLLTRSASEDDELRALLHDEPVTQVTQGALSSTGAGGGDGTTDAGTPVGTAGNSGAAGAITGGAGPRRAGWRRRRPRRPVDGTAVDGGSPTGIAGTTGSAGTTASPAAARAGAAAAPAAAAAAAARRHRRRRPVPGRRPARAVDLRRLHAVPHQPVRQQRAETTRPSGRSASRAAEGIAGQAVALANKDEDIVYVPEQPNFTFNERRHGGGLVRPHVDQPDAHAVPQARGRQQQLVRAGAEQRQVPVRRRPGQHARQRHRPHQGEGERMDPRRRHL